MPNASETLASIDYVIIVAYLIGVLVIGTYLGRYVHSAGDYFLAGKALPFWAIGMSIVASDIGAVSFVAGAGGAYRYGIAQANFDWIGSVPAALVAAFIFIPYFWRAGVYTIPEFLGKRYNAAVQIIEAGLWLVFLTTMLAVMLWLTAIMMKTVLGWSTTTAIWVTVVIVGVYTVSGGLGAVIMTDVIQMVVMFIGAGSLLVLSLIQAGGWDEMKTTVLSSSGEFDQHFTLLLAHKDPTPYPWTGIVFGLGIVLATAYFVGNQAVVQRTLAARTEWDAKAGMVLAGFLKLFIPVLIIIPGLAALALHPGLEKADESLPTLIRDILPPGLKGLMFAAFFAALMSSVDSYLNSSATLFTSDIYGKVFGWLAGRGATSGHGLIVGRVFTATMIVAAGVIAPVIERFETVYVAIQTLLSFFQGPTLAILLLGILWRGTTGWGALVGLVLGVGLTMSLTAMGEAVFPSTNPFLFTSLWSFVFSLIVTVLISLVTPAEPPEKIRGLVFGAVMDDPAIQEALQSRVGEPGGADPQTR